VQHHTAQKADSTLEGSEHCGVAITNHINYPYLWFIEAVLHHSHSKSCSIT